MLLVIQKGGREAGGRNEWDEGTSGLFHVYEEKEEEEEEQEEEKKDEERLKEEKWGRGSTVKCALVLPVAGLALVALVFRCPQSEVVP